MRQLTKYPDPLSILNEEGADGAAVLLGRELELTGVADVIQARLKNHSLITSLVFVSSMCSSFGFNSKEDANFVRADLNKRGIVVRGQ